MGGFFGAVANRDIVFDVFFGTDYHSHLGTSKAGMVTWNAQKGFTREIHSISSTPFRAKFEADLPNFKGTSGIGCISDSDPEPLLVRSHLGLYAIATIGVINNKQELINKYLSATGTQFMAMSSGDVNSVEFTAALINSQPTLVKGIQFAQDVIDGSLTLLILKDDGTLIAARDKMGRLPVLIAKSNDGYCISFESFAHQKLGYETVRELGPSEIAEVTCDGIKTLAPATKTCKICAFLWTYYGYPNSNYEGVNVEVMRYRNGVNMAKREAKLGTLPDVDYVAGMPDSGIPHAIGYANESHKPFARPFIKYTPSWLRSFMPTTQEMRDQVASMKQIPVPELIEDKKVLLVDDSIVRGTQLRETVDYLYKNGAQEVHMRSACPPIMYGCKYLNFSTSRSEMELLARRTIRKLEGEEGDNYLEEYADGTTGRGKCMLQDICDTMGFSSLGYQSLDGLIEAIGLDTESVCTYCWTGKE